ncbi:MAG: hypothetical protein QW127_04310, partial [Archaeoglobaceae archaeon]
SGVISFRNLVVEIASLERIETPIAIDGRLVVDESYLRTVVEIANLKLRKSKEKIERLIQLLNKK